MNGGRPHAISVSPCWSFVMFWMPAPGTTLMLKRGSFDFTSSTKPPACAYQPPPTCPAVQVRLNCCCAAAGMTATASARIRDRMSGRLMEILLGSSPFFEPRLVHLDAEPGAVESEDVAVAVPDGLTRD